MKTTGVAARGPLAALLALTLAGCGAEFGTVGGPGASPMRVTEGVRLRGTVRETVEIAGAGGSPFAQARAPTPFTATVRSGVAQLEEIGAVVAETRRRADGRRVLTLVDAGGSRHELVLVDSPGQGPPAAVRHFRDGVLLLEGAYRWEPRDGGWLLRERTVAVHAAGQPVLRHRRTIEAMELARRPGPRELLAALAGGVSGLVLAPELQAQNFSGCGSEWLEYAAASGALVAAANLAIASPLNPAAWSALFTALSVWERALTNLLNCEVRNAE